MDYIFRRLALDFLPYERRSELGIFTAAERAAQLRAEAAAASDAVSTGSGSHPAAIEEPVDLTELASSAPIEKRTPPAEAKPAEPKAARPATTRAGSSTELIEAVLGKGADAPLCFTCGTKMRPAGSCYVCEGCGSTSGCS